MLQNLLVKIITLQCSHKFCMSLIWIIVLTVSTAHFNMEIVEINFTLLTMQNIPPILHTS